MKKISRKIAERLVEKFNPVQSKIDQSAHELSVTFILLNGMLLLVRYNCGNFKKSYFIKKV